MKCLTCSCTSCSVCEPDANATGMSNVNWLPQSSETMSTTKFFDEVVGERAGNLVGTDEIDDGDAADMATLSDFLSRPVLIQSLTWSQTTPVGFWTSVNPWASFFNEARIAKKVANFAFMRGNLKLKVVVNGSPFYYGALRLCYRPLNNFKSDTIKGTNLQNNFLPYSQQPGIMIRPGKNQGGEMTLPFVWPKTWFRLGVDSLYDLGFLGYFVYVDLRSANAAAGQSVNVSVYAYMEDAQLTSSTLIPQSSEKDEYGDGPISRPASVVAATAAKLKDTPIIGKYATATEIGARAVSSIAKLFGFTNVPVIANTAPFAPAAGPILASTEQGFPLSKLTLDAKNELAVSPEATGLPHEDELVISKLCGHESIITTFSWDTTNVPNDLLFTSRVTPRMYYSTAITNNAVVDQTPMCMVSSLFKYWRGDIIFRFNIIRSEYHRGRLLISFDPSGSSSANVFNTSNTTTALYTTVVDIEEADNVEFRVPYQQALAYLTTRTADTWDATDVPWRDTVFNSAAVGNTCNGYISVRVLNELSAPVASATVTTIVSVRAADNIEFANPIDPPKFCSYFSAQSAEVTDVLTSKVPSTDPQRSRVYMGEKVVSLRPLVRRYCYLGPITLTGATGTTQQALYYFFHKMPPVWGFDPSGEQSVGKLVGSGNANFNYASWTPITWLANAFVYYRGSVNWTFNVDSPGKVMNNVMVQRIVRNANNGVSTASPTANMYAMAFQQAVIGNGGASGMTFTNQQTQGGLSLAVPNYTNHKFQTTNITASTVPAISGGSYDGSNLDTCALTILDNQIPAYTQLHRYVGAGTDFNLHFFLNVPSLVCYASIPNPA